MADKKQFLTYKAERNVPNKIRLIAVKHDPFEIACMQACACVCVSRQITTIFFSFNQYSDYWMQKKNTSLIMHRNYLNKILAL
jgi:hypothetical protein